MHIAIPDSNSPHTTTTGQRAWSRPVGTSRGISAGRRASRGTSRGTSRRTTPSGTPAGSGIFRCWFRGDGAGRVLDKGRIRSPRKKSIGGRHIGGSLAIAPKLSKGISSGRLLTGRSSRHRPVGVVRFPPLYKSCYCAGLPRRHQSHMGCGCAAYLSEPQPAWLF